MATLMEELEEIERLNNLVSELENTITVLRSQISTQEDARPKWLPEREAIIECIKLVKGYPKEGE